MKRFAIAVDGPAGSGKSTVAKRVAQRLGIVYVDTGAMYRTVALFCGREGIPLSAEGEVVAALQRLEMQILPQADGQHILLRGEDVTMAIRQTEIGKGASEVAAYEKVRERMVDLQREMAQSCSVIMDGRDIGTVVLPQAQVKIYLDAGVAERAKRRAGEMQAQGQSVSLAEIEEGIRRRDYNDMHRKHSPLRRAEDAVLLDSTGKSIEEVTQEILDIVAERGLTA